MNMQSYRVAIVAGGAAWVVVTLAALSVIVGAPSEHVDLAIGLGLVWVVLIGFAALSRFTERL